MEAIEQRIREVIASRGPVSFAEFMSMALYGPDGYYASEKSPIGEAGDYITGSSHSPLFAAATARLVERLDRRLGSPADVLEVGFGRAVHLNRLAELLNSTQRRLVGFDRASKAVLGTGVDRLGSLEALDERSIDGLIFSYELMDAQPVHRLVVPSRPEDPLREMFVDFRNDRFEWREDVVSDPRLGAFRDQAYEAGVTLHPGQLLDVSLEWAPVYERLAKRLKRGLLVTVDYGYGTRQLFDARVRLHGTLACYRQQTVHRDPFVHVGRQDLTAHVDFSVLRAAGERCGLATVLFTRQAPWLAELGLFDDLAGASLSRMSEAQRLLNPEGMGSDLRVLVQTLGLETEGLFAHLQELGSKLP